MYQCVANNTHPPQTSRLVLIDMNYLFQHSTKLIFVFFQRRLAAPACYIDLFEQQDKKARAKRFYSIRTYGMGRHAKMLQLP
jgi:hypothetical protein